MRMIGWCLYNTAAATASWSSVDLDGFLKRTPSGDGFRWAGQRAGGKRQPAWCSRKTQINFAIASMAKKLLHRCIGAHAWVHMHFCREYACLHRCCWAPCMCRCVPYTDSDVVNISVHICFTLATGCAYARMYVHFVSFNIGEWGWGGSTSL